MRNLGIILVAWIVISCSSSIRPVQNSAEYIGEKMWNTREMEPFNESVSLEIIDSVAYLTHHQSKEQRIDTFVYRDIHNSYYRYIREKSKFRWEYLLLSRDSVKLQIGEPMERNYFYRRHSVSTFVLCPECHGVGEILCPLCHGFGRVTPCKHGGKEVAAGICPLCHGSKSITHTPCRLCNGEGKIKK